MEYIIMDMDFLRKHRFQFIHFSHVYHPQKGDTGNVQLYDDLHILHICKGQGIFKLDDQSFTAKAGDVVAMPSFTPWTMKRTSDFEMMNIHYKIWLYDGTHLEDVKRLPLFFTPSYFNWCYEKLLELEEIIRNPRKVADVLAHEIIIKHFTENPLIDVAGSVSGSRMQKVKRFLETPEINFDSNELASLCLLSKSQMNRNFKALFGISPHKYWEKQRINYICMLLKKSPVKINEISERWGFKNSGYFCRWFKKMTSYAPTEYRKAFPEK
jgi:AraC-like DNA-binding protein